MSFSSHARSTMAKSNVIVLNVPQHRHPLKQRLAAHAGLFAFGRRGDGDVFWLKENAEFLNILECTGQPGDPVLASYEEFYDRIDARLGEFPQYFRFHLSMCLDLEDLGMPGDKGAKMCRWIAEQGLVDAELSDLQRAETQRLLARRGVEIGDKCLADRLQGFLERTRTFAVPNRKAAYELTHIVFYLSEYGRRDPQLGEAAIRSLTYAGILAYLDQNHDLLAEICVALRFAGRKPSAIWEDAVVAALGTARDSSGEEGRVADDYHTYLVSSWLAALSGQEIMPLKLLPHRTRIDLAKPVARPLLDMGRMLGELRNGDWQAVRWRIMANMDEAAQNLIDAAERSTEEFEEFYEGFARVTAPAC